MKNTTLSFALFFVLVTFKAFSQTDPLILQRPDIPFSIFPVLGLSFGCAPGSCPPNVNDWKSLGLNGIYKDGATSIATMAGGMKGNEGLEEINNITSIPGSF